jgi:hypothetical protein
LPVTGELLRGSLLQRIVRHIRGCAKCAGRRAPGVGSDRRYPGGRTRQLSLRCEQVAEVRRWLGNYQEPKRALEAICEFNHLLLRPQAAARKPKGKPRD